MALHGGKQQDVRVAAVDAFKAGQYEVLVATDVAGRGLDIKGIKHVINYDMPAKIEGAFSGRHRCGGGSIREPGTMTDVDSHGASPCVGCVI